MITVTYSTFYGSSREYALSLATWLGVNAAEASVADISSSDAVVHFGSLYAGSVLGLKDVLGNLGDNARLIVVTVGIADPSVDENKENIEKRLKKIIPCNVMKRTVFFHLRGRLDYKNMSPRHRAMMWMLRGWILRKKERSEEDEMIINTYSGCVDYMDFASLDGIKRYLKPETC